jgi:hypothetical protein
VAEEVVVEEVVTVAAVTVEVAIAEAMATAVAMAMAAIVAIVETDTTAHEDQMAGTDEAGRQDMAHEDHQAGLDLTMPPDMVPTSAQVTAQVGFLFRFQRASSPFLFLSLMTMIIMTISTMMTTIASMLQTHRKLRRLQRHRLNFSIKKMPDQCRTEKMLAQCPDSIHSFADF